MHRTGALGSTPSPFTREEDDELYPRCAQAKDLSDAGSPYFVDAVAEIVRWYEHRRLARYERAQEERARGVRELVELLRETDPRPTRPARSA